MRYMLLIYENEAAWASRSEAEQGAIFEEYNKFTAEIQAAGQLVTGDPLQPTSTATSVRRREGRTLTTDGPFAETKEQLGGYYVIEARDLDEALGVAARIPSAAWGTIEVRPVMSV